MGDDEKEKPQEKNVDKDKTYQPPDWAKDAAVACGFVLALLWFPAFLLVDWLVFDPEKSNRFEEIDAPFCTWLHFGPISPGKRARISVKGNEEDGKYGGLDIFVTPDGDTPPPADPNATKREMKGGDGETTVHGPKDRAFWVTVHQVTPTPGAKPKIRVSYEDA